MTEGHRYEVSSKWVREKIVRMSIGGKQDFEVTTPIDFWPQAPTNLLSPEDLLVASVVSCYGVSLSGIAGRFHADFADFSLHGVGTLKEGDNGWEFEKIVLKVNIQVATEEDKKKMAKVAERAHTHCLVAKSLKFPIILETELQMGH